ncbi:MAG: DUF177 domain-containing protein [Chloroflexi bacterium]|nr:DUF177 domain-containing protein [Chloroflexota bacterium]
MIYSVSQLLKSPVGTTRFYDLDEDIKHLDADILDADILDADIHPLSNLTGHIRMVRTADGILVTGQLKVALEMECVRCLEPVAVPVKFEVEEEFVPTIDLETGAALPIADGQDEALLIDERHMLDLGEIFRQDILLAMPTHPLCRTDCKGLCVTCGQNLNEGSCDCHEEQADPRWEALRDLLENTSTN